MVNAKDAKDAMDEEQITLHSRRIEELA